MLVATCVFSLQYLFTVSKDETEVMISLVQKDVRDQRGLKGAKDGSTSAKGSGENFTIGYHVMKVGVANRVVSVAWEWLAS